MRSGLGDVTPMSFSAGVRLRDWSVSPVPLKKSEPRVVLPPVFGTRFMTSPPVSFSPSPLAAANVTSSAAPASTT